MLFKEKVRVSELDVMFGDLPRLCQGEEEGSLVQEVHSFATKSFTVICAEVVVSVTLVCHWISLEFSHFVT